MYVLLLNLMSNTDHFWKALFRGDAKLRWDEVITTHLSAAVLIDT